MAKLIAVCGAPASGKTTFSLKLAMEINSLEPDKESNTVFLSPDLNVPSMSLIYPRCKKEELYSLGPVIDRTDIYRDDLLKSMNGVKTLSNFGMLGFVCGENRYSYPSPTEDKVMELLSWCKKLAKTTVVDCCSGDDLISRLAIANAEVIVQLISPDIKSAAYYSSCGELPEELTVRRIKLLNMTDANRYAPVAEITAQMKGVDYTLPHSEALKQQMLTGTLTERLNDNSYRKVVKAIAQAVM